MPPASIRSTCADFAVTEILGFAADGDGEHDLLLVEKTGQNTNWVAATLARFAGIPRADVGFAGMKDRHAVTRQWFSVRRPAGDKPDWGRFAADGVRILEATRHRRKLKRGAHRGNRFRIALRDLGAPPQALEAQLDAIRRQGFPNYFGEQRFGHGGQNLELAAEFLNGRRLPRERRSLALSAARSYLFNLVLDRRVVDGTWDRLLPGDCANLDGSGSIFPVASVDAGLRQRAAELDLHPTGPLWGRGKVLVSGGVAELEQAIADANSALARGLERQQLAIARRPLRARARDLEWRAEGERALWLEFSLDSGVFATSLLRELVTASEPAAMRGGE